MSRRKDPSSVRICEVLLEMRRCRMGLIQTADQLRFSYLAIIEGAKYIKGDSSVQVGHLKSNWSSFTKTSVSRFSPSEGFVAGALKRGRPPSRLLPSSSSAAPPRITQWPNWLSFPRTDFPRIIWHYRALREPQPGVNTEIFLNAQLQLVAVSLLSTVNMKLF